MNDSPKLGQYAEYCATTLGWSIFPCHGMHDGRCTCADPKEDPKNRGKHPANFNGQKGATTDAATIAGWWTDNPHYNIGVYCKASGFLVIDIDPRSGGFESFEKFEELLNWSLGPTVEAVTGLYTYKGKQLRGRHLYYKYDGEEGVVPNLKDANLPGLDFKYQGYVLLPPSAHASGVNYEWREGHAPWDIPMADASPELLSAIVKQNSYKPSSGRLSKMDLGSMGDLQFGGKSIDLKKYTEGGATVDEGHRATELFRIACAVANKVDVNTEFGRSAVETWMIRFNAEHVNPPLPLEGPGGLLSHVHNATDYIARNPKGNLVPEVEEWQKEAAQRMSEGTFRSAPTAPQVPKAVASTQRDADTVDEYDMYVAPGTVGGAVAAAAQAGLSAADASRLTNIDVPKDTDALTAEEGGMPGKRSLTDVGNGRRIVDSFGAVMRYTPGLGWFHWSGSHWQFDKETLYIKEQSKKIAAIISSEVVEYDDDDKMKVHQWATQARSSSRLNSAIEVAKTDPRIRVDVEGWDSDPHLFGVANGVVDLRSGELFQGRPDLNITKHSPIAYTPGVTSAKFQKFLDEATNNDKELQDWIQRAAGYTLTGLSHLDNMFLVYGPPGSGKNTLVEAFVKCMGTAQYAWPLDSAVLGADDGHANRSDEYHWAKLIGKRMVWADELPEGERIKENSVKKLTGSSEISARSPGESPFTFSSQAKLWLTTNHRPMITDDAMWRRIRPVPWVHVPEHPDPSLKEYLFDPNGGLPAILAWMVEGAIKFLSSPSTDGLGWCKAVYDAAEMYRKSEDRIGLFFEEETAEAAGSEIFLMTLHRSYQSWSESRGEKPLALGKFQRKLLDRGYNIVGNGASAILYDYTQKIKAAGASGDINWAQLGNLDLGWMTN